MVTPEASRFTITLFCGQDITVQKNAAVQVSFNLAANNATMNSMRNGKWDRECFVQGVPFDHGEGFEVFVLCEQSFYKIFVNGNHYGEFPQNVSYDKITYLAIKGDVGVECVSFEPDVSFQFMVGNKLIYKMQYPMVQHVSYDPITLPLNVTCVRESRRPLNWKVYAVYGGIILLTAVTVLCIVFVPSMGPTMNMISIKNSIKCS